LHFIGFIPACTAVRAIAMRVSLPLIMGGMVQAADISSVAELNAAIEAGSTKVCFLSQANYNSVHTLLSAKTEAVILSDTSHMYDAVKDGTCVAGLISGQPDPEAFIPFSSELISPRAFQTAPGDPARHLLEALDAAVVRTHNAGDMRKAEADNPPFRAVQVNTCRSSDPGQVPFPDAATATGLLADVLTTRKLKLLAYGAPDALPNWVQDGNYEVTPPTGFWPDYIRAVEKYIAEAYREDGKEDITVERVWRTDAAGTEMVLNGTIHATEPYYIYENFHGDQLKKWQFGFSCVVVGYEQQFFSKRSSYVMISDGDSCEGQLAACISQAGAEVTSIDSVHDLNIAAAQAALKVGFLSEANYQSVHTMLSANIQAEFFSDTTELYNAVQSGAVRAGLISGQPNATLFRAFASELISPRAFQVAPGEAAKDLVRALDAAVVRTHNSGALRQAEADNPPFRVVEVHTCRSSDPDKVPFPVASSATGLLADVLTTRKLKVLSYGSPDDLPDWHQDGNYQVTPATGFWPDYMRAIKTHLATAYREAGKDDITIERVWRTDAAGTEMVLNGTIHATEPYYIYENFFGDKLKKWQFDFSCVVLGYEQQFFVQRQTMPFGEGTCTSRLTRCQAETGGHTDVSSGAAGAALAAAAVTGLVWQ